MDDVGLVENTGLIENECLIESTGFIENTGLIGNKGFIENTGLTENIISESVPVNRYLWVDLIRITAIFAAVAIHVDNFSSSWNQIPWMDWWAANVYNAIIRFAVPILFVLSGYLLLDKQEDDLAFFSKRLRKVVIPLIAWSMIYMIFSNKYDVFSIFTEDFVQRFLANRVFYHLHFLYSIIGLYIITPVLRRVLAHVTMHDIYFFLALWFLFTPFNQLIQFFGYDIGIPLEIATGNLGLYIAGHAIKNTRITSKIIFLSFMVVTGSIMLMSFGTYFMSLSIGEYDNQFMSMNITQTMYAICLFILLREAAERMSLVTPSIMCKIINAVAGASLGIYLIHPMLLHYYVHYRLYDVFLLSPSYLGLALFIPMVTALLFIASLIIVTIMKKIPLVRIIVP
ncbi:acyltransferase family protein [Methanosarcina hadiensis]|uniref:acyltransferase n=1 Tax=Methanosarcina hadiensis TaxID=3078083 RepID=UPI0039779398